MFTTRMGRAVKLAVLGAVVVVAPAARAADYSPDKVPSSYMAMMKMKPEAVFNMMDQDKKGYVTKEEFLKFQEQLFEKMDKSKDGHLTMPEFTDRG